MPDTAVIVGSVELAAQSVTVNGGGAVQIDAGSYYLRHGTASISLLDALETLLDAQGVTGPSVTMRQNYRIRVSSTNPFDFTLSSRLQRLLGFSGAQSGASSYDATLQSPLLWAPGYPATPASRTGKSGYKRTHTTKHKSDDGSRIEEQYFGEEIWQELEWPFVPAELLSVADGTDDGGTFEGLFEEVLKLNRPWQWYESMSFDGVTTNGVIWSTAFGPYQLRDEPGNPNWYDRLRANADDIGGAIGLEAMVVEELSNA